MNIFEHLQCKDRLRILNVVLDVSSEIAVGGRLVLYRCSRLCFFIVQDVFIVIFLSKVIHFYIHTLDKLSFYSPVSWWPFPIASLTLCIDSHNIHSLPWWSHPITSHPITSQHIPPHHIPSHPTTSHHIHHIPLHPIPSHRSPSHPTTSHHILLHLMHHISSHPITSHTSHHITS